MFIHVININTFFADGFLILIPADFSIHFKSDMCTNTLFFFLHRYPDPLVTRITFKILTKISRNQYEIRICDRNF